MKFDYLHWFAMSKLAEIHRRSQEGGPPCPHPQFTSILYLILFHVKVSVLLCFVGPSIKISGYVNAEIIMTSLKTESGHPCENIH